MSGGPGGQRAPGQAQLNKASSQQPRAFAQSLQSAGAFLPSRQPQRAATDHVSTAQGADGGASNILARLSQPTGSAAAKPAQQRAAPPTGKRHRMMSTVTVVAPPSRDPANGRFEHARSDAGDHHSPEGMSDMRLRLQQMQPGARGQGSQRQAPEEVHARAERASLFGGSSQGADAMGQNAPGQGAARKGRGQRRNNAAVAGASQGGGLPISAPRRLGEAAGVGKRKAGDSEAAEVADLSSHIAKRPAPGRGAAAESGISAPAEDASTRKGRAARFATSTTAAKGTDADKEERAKRFAAGGSALVKPAAKRASLVLSADLDPSLAPKPYKPGQKAAKGTADDSPAPVAKSASPEAMDADTQPAPQPVQAPPVHTKPAQPEPASKPAAPLARSEPAPKPAAPAPHPARAVRPEPAPQAAPARPSPPATALPATVASAAEVPLEDGVAAEDGDAAEGEASELEEADEVAAPEASSALTDRYKNLMSMLAD
jgi:hypothetical protein